MSDETSATGLQGQRAFENEDKHSAAAHILSCKPCRQRKVRCDRNDPCTQCTQKQLFCSFPTGFKHRQRRQKTLVSDRCEEKLNEIAEKVDRIYLAVDNGGTAHSSSSQPTFIIPQPCPYTPASTGSVAQYASDSAGSDLEGELSLNAHAAYATDYVQQAMGSNAHVSGGMMSSLHTLRQAIEGSSKENLPKGNSLPAEPVKFSTGDSCISLPDMPYAMSCLQRLRESERLWYCWSWEIESVGEFIEYLLPVYSGQPSLAEVIIVNDGLCRLFTECSRDEGNINVSREMLAQAETCHKNLKNAIRRLPFLIPSTFDYALALFLASMHLLQSCRTLLAWKCISEASQICCTLGYNRETALVPETASKKRRRARLFWLILTMDKLLSLSLGRSSTLRDVDITLSRPANDMSDIDPRFVWPLSKWIDYSFLYGKIYEELFSPRALQQPESFRLKRVGELATELQLVFDSTNPAETQHLQARVKFLGPVIHELLERAEKVAHLSTLTLVYRGIPASPCSGSAFSEDCIAVAHEALAEHQHCLNLLRKVERSFVEMYLEWTMLSSPFIPFIVLFCRIVQTGDSLHLDKLASVVETLQMASMERLPETFEKQLRIFKLMYDLAHGYLEAKKSETERHASICKSQSGGTAYSLNLPMLESEMGPPSISSSSQQRVPGWSDFVQDHGPVATEFGSYGGDMFGIEQVLPQMGSPGVDLGSWFDQSHQIMRMMGDEP